MTSFHYYNNLDRDYLIKQNRKLRMQLKQSNNIKQLHQNALMQMNQKYSQSKIISTLIDIITQSSNQSKIHELNEIIMQLQAKVMVLEKIATQTQQNQKQTYNLLAMEFQKLKQENHKKQDQLHKFYEKIGQVDYISGLVTKYKEVFYKILSYFRQFRPQSKPQHLKSNNNNFLMHQISSNRQQKDQINKKINL